jgi:hypothetical protein
MPPRITTPRQSLKTIKGKGFKLGEVSIPIPFEGVKPLKSVELVIMVPLKKVLIQLPLYRDTEPTTRTKVLLPTWIEYFIKIREEDYSTSTQHNDPTIKVINDLVFSNV